MLHRILMVQLIHLSQWLCRLEAPAADLMFDLVQVFPGSDTNINTTTQHISSHMDYATSRPWYRASIKRQPANKKLSLLGRWILPAINSRWWKVGVVTCDSTANQLGYCQTPTMRRMVLRDSGTVCFRFRKAEFRDFSKHLSKYLPPREDGGLAWLYW